MNDSYDDEINSGNRLVLILFAVMVVFLGSMIYVSATSITDGLEAYYKLDETTGLVATDFSGNGNDGTMERYTFNHGEINGGVTIEDGAMVFNGTNGYVELPNSDLNNVTAFTISAWIRSSDWGATTKNNVIYQERESYPSKLVQFLYRSEGSNRLSLFIGDGSNGVTVNDLTFIPSVDTWYYVTATFDGSNNGQVKLYVNGSNTKTQDSGLASISTGNGLYKLIGSFTKSAGQYFNGNLNDLQIYNRALTSDEITAQYNAGRGSYALSGDGLVAQYSGRDYNATHILDSNPVVEGATSNTTYGKRFDGTDNYIELNSPIVTDINSVTISAWIKANNLDNLTTIGGQISNKYITSSTRRASYLFGLNSNGKFQTRYFPNPSSSINAAVISTTTVNLNEWYHVSFTNKDGLGKLYVNGVLESSNSNMTQMWSKEIQFINNNRAGGTYSFLNGSIDEVGVWSRALSEDEIQYLYESSPHAQTTFESEQVTGTTDQNITLTCTSINGCKTINYNIDNTVWFGRSAGDYNFRDFNSSYSGGGTRIVYTSPVGEKNYILRGYSSVHQSPGCGPEHPMSGYFTIYYNDSSTYTSSNYSAIGCGGGSATVDFNADYKDVNYITVTASGSFYTPAGDWNFTLYQNNPNLRNFLYSGSGDHNIQYFSTDNSDNNETIKTSNFTTYGNASFNFIDENTYAPVTTTYTINPSINGISTGSTTSLDLNLQGITNQLYGFQFSAAGYGTRFYYTDLNEFSDLDFNQLMLQDANAANNITLKIYNATGTTLQAGTAVTITKNNYLVGKYLTNTDGEINPFLNDLDTNYLFYVEGSYTTSQRPVLVYRPKYDSNFADITGDWQITLTGPNSTNRYTITTNSQVIAILPNTETLYSAKICMLSGSVCSTTYFSRTYLLGFKGLVGETSIQPYLNLVADSTLRTLKVLDYATNQPYPLAKIVITSKTDLGATYIVESLYTDSTGTAGVYLTNGQTYALTANDLTTYTIVPNAETLTYYIYFNFLVLPTETIPGLDVNTSNDFNGAEFFVMRNTLFGCSGTSDCFPSALIAIVLTMIILVVATAVTVGNFIGVKGLSLIAFICFTIFFGIGWLPVYIFAFLGSITLLLLVVVQ